MHIHCILHISFERLGAINDWIIKKGHTLSETHVYKGESLPTDMNQFDFLILMGGPQSPLELDKYPYIRDEINLVKKAIKTDKVVFGICLGAQIIAEALGAKTERSPHKEVGEYPVSVLESGNNDVFFSRLAPVFNAIHWHNDMLGLPENAILLAKSEGCPRQAFKYGDRVYGFQFHLEPTTVLLKEMIAHCPGDLLPGQYIQSAAELSNIDCEKINNHLYLFLDEMETLVTNHQQKV